MTEIYYTKGYEELKGEIKAEMSRSMDSFVRIGYLLKVARDTDILANSPYKNMEEFASAEFHIDKGTASKFMAINDRFSEGGCSDHLLPEYVGLGWSKLSLMLSLPREIAEEITPEFSKADIQAIKEEYEEEQKVTDLEVLLEGEEAEQKGLTLLEKVVHSLGQANPGLYADMYNALCRCHFTGTKNTMFREGMSPTGEDVYTGVKVQGIGKFMLSAKENTVAIINARSGEKELHTWDELEAAWKRIFPEAEDAGHAWEETYKRPWQEPEGKKPEVAPVQPGRTEPERKKTEKKTEKKKPKVIKAAKPGEKPKELPAPEPGTEGQNEIREERGAENGQEETPESRKNTKCGGQITKEEFKRRYDEIGDSINIIKEAYLEAEFGLILDETQKLAELAEGMLEVEIAE